MLSRRANSADRVGRQCADYTARMTLSSSGLLRVPILIEYDELKGWNSMP